MVAARLGLALPFSCAEVFDRSDAAVVMTVGGAGVVNVMSDPNDVPTPLLAIAHTK